MITKALDLFEAYGQNKLPRDGGYIISSFFDENSPYSIYEVAAYSGVKTIYLSNEGLTFQADGNKLFILVEPPGFHKKHIEPFRRSDKKQIPYRFNELNIITARNQSKVMVSKEPVLTYASFTIIKPTGSNFAFIFYNLPYVLDSLKIFFEKTLNVESKIPQADAKKATPLIMDGLKKFTIWHS